MRICCPGSIPYSFVSFGVTLKANTCPNRAKVMVASVSTLCRSMKKDYLTYFYIMLALAGSSVVKSSSYYSLSNVEKTILHVPLMKALDQMV